MRRRIVGVLIVATLLMRAVTAPLEGYAITVFDPSNFAQNVLTAFRTLQSNLNEVEMLANQVRQIEMMIKNLERLDFDILDDYNSQFQQLFHQLGTVDGLVNSLGTLSAKFEELYPLLEASGAAPMLPEEFEERVNEMRRQSQHMVQGSLRVAATVIEQLPQTQAQFDQLVASSQGAAGILQATQSGNQMLAMLGSEVMKMNTMIAHFQQVTVAAQAQKNVEEAEQRKAEKKLLEGWDNPLKKHSVRPDGIW